MKIVFFGSSEFAVSSLEMLANSAHEVLAVVTQPDREKGRHLKKSPTPVKNAAMYRGIEVFQPDDISDTSFKNSLKALNPDLFVVVSFGEIIPKNILGIPKFYSVNLHASYLPHYRGAAPINWAIINGEEKTGLTIIKMNEKMDAGDIVLQKKIKIEKEDTSETLTRRASELGAVLLLDAIRLIEEDRVKFKSQAKKKPTFAPKLKKEDGLIDWKKTAEDIHNLARGLMPWPGAFTFLGDKMIKIWKTETRPLYEKMEPGKILDIEKDAILVSCGRGMLVIKELQLEGKKRMDAASFARGQRIEKGSFLGKTGQNPCTT